MTTMWPWLLIAAGVCLIVGALIYRQRMLSRFYDEVENHDEDAPIGGAGPSADGEKADPTERSSGPEQGRVEPAAERLTDPRRAADTDEQPTSEHPRVAAAPAGAASAGSGSDPYAGLSDSHVLSEPPTIRWGETSVVLHDWMRYYAEGNVWSDVLSKFTESVDADAELRSYFTASTDGSLARHSLSTLMMLTTQGITVGDVRRMKSAHAEVKNEQGEPINAFVWNQLVDALSGALRDSGVRDATLAKLGETLEPLRAAIVPSSS